MGESFLPPTLHTTRWVLSLCAHPLPPILPLVSRLYVPLSLALFSPVHKLELYFIHVEEVLRTVVDNRVLENHITYHINH